ncbi:MAG: ATP synthase F0 subunit B [Desulfovibrio sp.]|nr:ATP synthase F0 subunit B [Desulfovibrio sp.]
MLDLNITLLFQLVNFLVAIVVLNYLLIKPIREIIKKRKGVMDEISGEAGSFESQASQRLDNYEAELARARQEAGITRVQGREAGQAEQSAIVGDAQGKAREIIDEARRKLQQEAQATLAELRGQVGSLSDKLAYKLIKG